MDKKIVKYCKDFSTQITELPQTSDGNAGIDLRSAEDCQVIEAGQTRLIKTSFKYILPKNTVGFVCSRSGLALKNSVAVLNAPGIIDENYRGNLGVILHNFGHESFEINFNDRIAQLVIVPTVNVELKRIDVDEFNDHRNKTDRDANGFGSTGVK